MRAHTEKVRVCAFCADAAACIIEKRETVNVVDEMAHTYGHKHERDMREQNSYSHTMNECVVY